jgi:hypothetical protein
LLPEHPPIVLDDDADYTQLQRSKIEIENLRALSYVTGLTVKETVSAEDQENIKFNLQLRLNVHNSFISIYIELSPDYPNELPHFTIGESFMVKASYLTHFQSLIKKIPQVK